MFLRSSIHPSQLTDQSGRSILHVVDDDEERLIRLALTMSPKSLFQKGTSCRCTQSRDKKSAGAATRPKSARRSAVRSGLDAVIASCREIIHQKLQKLHQDSFSLLFDQLSRAFPFSTRLEPFAWPAVAARTVCLLWLHRVTSCSCLV